MNLEMNLHQEAERVASEIAALQAAENESFTVSQRKYLGDDPLLVLVAPAADGATLVALGGGHPPPLAQDLAVGVLRGDELVAVSRTGGSGILAVRLEPGEYKLRFVVEVRDAMDEEILRRLGDRLAREQLAIQGHDRTLAHPVQPESVANIWKPLYRSPSALAGGSTDDVPAPPSQELDSTQWDDGEIRLLYRAWLIPYGVVLIKAVEQPGGRTLGHKVVALPQFEHDRGPYRAGAISLQEIAGDAMPNDVTLGVTPAAPEHFELFRRHLPELQRLRDEPIVAYDEELSKSVQALCDGLEDRAT
jgi:hypothetical protein